MRYFKWIIVFIVIFISALCLRPKEIVQAPPQEAGETLTSTGRIEDHQDKVKVSPYFCKKGAGARVTLTF